MTGRRPDRGLLATGALSAGLVVVGEAFAVPLLPGLGTLIGLTVLSVVALEGFLVGGGATDPVEDHDDGTATEADQCRRVGGPLAVLFVAGGTVSVGLAADVRALVLFGSLVGLAVAGGLATLGVLASVDGSGSAGTDSPR